MESLSFSYKAYHFFPYNPYRCRVRRCLKPDLKSATAEATHPAVYA